MVQQHGNVENVQPGLFLKDPNTGKRLLFGASTEDVRILESEEFSAMTLYGLTGRLCYQPLRRARRSRSDNVRFHIVRGQ